jgi:hypothetical protein
MACRGVHFAITNDQLQRLLAASSDDDVLEVMQEDVEEAWEEEWLRETDKAWDAIHRCLTDGKLGFGNGSFPLNAVVLGGKQLYRGEDYIISLVEPKSVLLVAEALDAVDREVLRQGYERIAQTDYDGEIGEEDFEYTWHWFKELPGLFCKAAAAKRAVVFSVDQ